MIRLNRNISTFVCLLLFSYSELLTQSKVDSLLFELFSKGKITRDSLLSGLRASGGISDRSYRIATETPFLTIDEVARYVRSLRPKAKHGFAFDCVLGLLDSSLYSFQMDSSELESFSIGAWESKPPALEVYRLKSIFTLLEYPDIKTGQFRFLLTNYFAGGTWQLYLIGLDTLTPSIVPPHFSFRNADIASKSINGCSIFQITHRLTGTEYVENRMTIIGVLDGTLTPLYETTTYAFSANPLFGYFVQDTSAVSFIDANKDGFLDIVQRMRITRWDSALDWERDRGSRTHAIARTHLWDNIRLTFVEQSEFK